MFEQAQIQEFKEVGGFGRNDRGSLMRCDLQLFPQCFQSGDSWFATRGSTPAFESFHFKSANNNSATIVKYSIASKLPRSPHPAEEPAVSRRAGAHPPKQLPPAMPGAPHDLPPARPAHGPVDPSCRDNWPQLGLLVAQAVLPSWSHPGARGLCPQGRGSAGH